MNLMNGKPAQTPAMTTDCSINYHELSSSTCSVILMSQHLINTVHGGSVSLYTVAYLSPFKYSHSLLLFICGLTFQIQVTNGSYCPFFYSLRYINVTHLSMYINFFLRVCM